jgi:hypothetical protein
MGGRAPQRTPKRRMILRKLHDGVPIGTMSTEMPDGSRSPLALFVLIGPTDEWVGEPDSGRDA